MLRWLTPLLILGCSACGSTVQHHWVADDFQRTQLQEGKLIVAAVVALPELHRQGHGAERAYTERLDQILRQKRPDLNLIEHRRLIDRYDLDALDAILSRYRERGSLDPESLNQLKRLGEDAQFAAFCRLEDNREQQKAGDSMSADSGDNRVDYSSTYETKRIVVASFDIFDVQSGRLVWTAQLTKDDERKTSREYGSRDLSGSREVEPSFRWSGSGGFPEAPEFLDLLTAMFQDFGMKLPR